MNTISLPYGASSENSDIIFKYMKNQNNVIKFLYNRLSENKDLCQKSLTSLVNSMNNIFVGSWLKQSAVYKAQDLIEHSEKIIFGGKKLFFERQNNKINKEDFQKQKQMPLFIIGEKKKLGNRLIKFQIIENNKIILKLDKKLHLELTLPKLRNNYKKILYKLQRKAEQGKLAVTFSVDLNKLYITYDEVKFRELDERVIIKNRIMTSDMNPNFNGYSVIDWKNQDEKNIVNTGMVSIKKINDAVFALRASSDSAISKYWNHKREHEIFEIVKRLVQIAVDNHVECFCIENLDIKPGDKRKGSKYNRLVNNMWCRGKFVSNLKKRLNLAGIKLYEIFPQYSSFIGNLMNRTYPDPVAASIEMNRRCYCFKNQIKPVIFPDFVKSIKIIKQSLEELRNGTSLLIDKIGSWKKFYDWAKNSDLRYRISLENLKRNFKVFRLSNRKSLVDLYQFA